MLKTQTIGIQLGLETEKPSVVKGNKFKKKERKK